VMPAHAANVEAATHLDSADMSMPAEASDAAANLEAATHLDSAEMSMPAEASDAAANLEAATHLDSADALDDLPHADTPKADTQDPAEIGYPRGGISVRAHDVEGDELPFRDADAPDEAVQPDVPMRATADDMPVVLPADSEPTE